LISYWFFSRKPHVYYYFDIPNQPEKPYSSPQYNITIFTKLASKNIADIELDIIEFDSSDLFLLNENNPEVY